ncbi:16391_t:CDS:2, partial [Gigaspora rosea]
ERSSSTKALTYPLGLENTNTDNNYTVEAQPYFDFKKENVIDSYEESANIDHDEIDDDTEDELDFIERTKAEINEESTENIIIGDPIRVKHKGHQPKQYRSEGEDLPRKKKLRNIQDTSNVAKRSTGFSNAKSVRHCQKCGQS